MKLFEYIDEQVFNDMVNKNYINVVNHPNDNGYRIINYSKTCQAEKIWNDTTIKCRGLIVDGNDNIIAKPFKKFFNYEEIEDISIIPTTEAFDVYEKMDGSLGILYWINDVPYIATKGSFKSEQAIHATRILHTRYRNVWDKLDKNITFLFEIIYPDDLHCVTYKDIDDIYLIGALSTIDENKEWDIENFSNFFKTTKKYDGVKEWKTLRDVISGDNREGFVIRFRSSNFRFKLKYEQYWKLHFLQSGLTPKKILDSLINDDMEMLNKAFELFDEEHIIYYSNIINNFKKYYKEIEDVALSEYRDDFETQKDAAMYFMTCTHPSVLFAMRNKKDYSKIIWRYIKKQY